MRTTIHAIDDQIIEGTETVTMQLLPGEGYGLLNSVLPYVPSSITAYIGDNEGGFSVTPYGGPIHEAGGALQGGFTFHRDNTSGPLDVSYTVDVSVPSPASAGQDYSPLSGSVHFDTGVGEVQVPLVPTDDSTPEWTENVTVRVSQVGAMAAELSANQEIVDEDLGISGLPDALRMNNDDDDGDGTADKDQSGGVGGEDDLVAVTLDTPQDVKPGAAVTLTAPNDKVRVWENYDRSGAEFIDASHGSHTWTMGGDTLPSIVYVEAIAGSVAVNDVVLTLADSDGGATPAPTYPTAASASTMTTAYGVAIYADDLTTDVTNKSRDWIVGRNVRLYAVVSAPDDWRIQLTYEWTVPGNVLRDYAVSADSATTIPLTRGSEWDAFGTDMQAIAYFWVSASLPGPDTDKVSVHVGNIGGHDVTVDTTFRLYSPTANVNAIAGTVQVLWNDPNTVGLFPTIGSTETGGMVWRGQVDVPQQFAGGTWAIVQLTTPDDFLTTPSGEARTKYQYNDIAGLDGTFPYGTELPVNVPEQGHQDSPHITLSPTNASKIQISDNFYTWILFKPSGSANWVPLQYMFWRMDCTANSNGQAWSVVSPSGLYPSATPSFTATDVYPVWSFVHQQPFNYIPE